ncbi:MAG TPA: hypothetical protein VMR28_02110 [Candidatus Saccharimonadales bacterium]|nr:hypothetical protein [Candidatus Saccharimonadales bacterium]
MSVFDFDTSPPQPGGVHLQEAAIETMRRRNIHTPQEIGCLVAAQLIGLGASPEDTYQIVDELARELPETIPPNKIMGPRELFVEGAHRQLETVTQTASL